MIHVDDRWKLRIETAYSEPHRYYHTLAHLENMFAESARFAPLPPAVEWAIWFHDFVYDPRSATNEEDSHEHTRLAPAPHTRRSSREKQPESRDPTRPVAARHRRRSRKPRRVWWPGPTRLSARSPPPARPSPPTLHAPLARPGRAIPHRARGVHAEVPRAGGDLPAPGLQRLRGAGAGEYCAGIEG